MTPLVADLILGGAMLAFLIVMPNKIQRLIINICRRDRWRAWLHPEEQLQTMGEDWGPFAYKAFAQDSQPLSGHLNHIRSEIDEVEKELQICYGYPRVGEESYDKVAYEIADIVILCLSLAWRVGIYNLAAYVVRKIAKNKKRKWGAANPVSGIIHHTSEG